MISNRNSFMVRLSLVTTHMTSLIIHINPSKVFHFFLFFSFLFGINILRFFFFNFVYKNTNMPGLGILNKWSQVRSLTLAMEKFWLRNVGPSMSSNTSRDQSPHVVTRGGYPEHGSKLRTAICFAASILWMRWSPRRQLTAIVMWSKITYNGHIKTAFRPQRAMSEVVTDCITPQQSFSPLLFKVTFKNKNL